MIKSLYSLKKYVSIWSDASTGAFTFWFEFTFETVCTYTYMYMYLSIVLCVSFTMCFWYALQCKKNTSLWILLTLSLQYL